VSTEPQSNVERLGIALAPFAGADLVALFRSDQEVAAIHAALEEIASDGLVTLMIGANQGLTGTWHGIEGFTEAWRDFTETFRRLSSEITELVEPSPGVVYSETRQVGVTATAGMEIEYEAAGIFRFADGRLLQAEFHLDRPSARKAAGIDPDLIG